ncbi:MAG TPA: DNA gyrase inhibitor YacG [Rhizomicrobium sp.]|nr:DNA gyrase inhibitor YacG [Rhizomicrobium sp.]
MSQPAESGVCPICGKPRDPRLRPFCSRRCADIDLARWFKGEYAIPGAPPGDESPAPDNDEPTDIH